MSNPSKTLFPWEARDYDWEYVRRNLHNEVKATIRYVEPINEPSYYEYIGLWGNFETTHSLGDAMFAFDLLLINRGYNLLSYEEAKLLSVLQ